MSVDLVDEKYIGAMDIFDDGSFDDRMQKVHDMYANMMWRAGYPYKKAASSVWTQDGYALGELVNPWFSMDKTSGTIRTTNYLKGYTHLGGNSISTSLQAINTAYPSMMLTDADGYLTPIHLAIVDDQVGVFELKYEDCSGITAMDYSDLDEQIRTLYLQYYRIEKVGSSTNDTEIDTQTLNNFEVQSFTSPDKQLNFSMPLSSASAEQHLECHNNLLKHPLRTFSFSINKNLMVGQRILYEGHHYRIQSKAYRNRVDWEYQVVEDSLLFYKTLNKDSTTPKPDIVTDDDRVVAKVFNTPITWSTNNLAYNTADKAYTAVPISVDTNNALVQNNYAREANRVADCSMNYPVDITDISLSTLYLDYGVADHENDNYTLPIKFDGTITLTVKDLPTKEGTRAKRIVGFDVINEIMLFCSNTLVGTQNYNDDWIIHAEQAVKVDDETIELQGCSVYGNSVSKYLLDCIKQDTLPTIDAVLAPKVGVQVLTYDDLGTTDTITVSGVVYDPFVGYVASNYIDTYSVTGIGRGDIADLTSAVSGMSLTRLTPVNECIQFWGDVPGVDSEISTNDLVIWIATHMTNEMYRSYDDYEWRIQGTYNSSWNKVQVDNNYGLYIRISKDWLRLLGYSGTATFYVQIRNTQYDVMQTYQINRKYILTL